MIPITKYKCEICNALHDTAEHALKCEAKGVFDANKFPIL